MAVRKQLLNTGTRFPAPARPPAVKPPPMVAAPSSGTVRATFPPVASAPAVAAPATPSTPATPTPFDPVYDQQKAHNRNVLDQTNTGLDAEQSSALRSFGLDDPSDPFSRAALLRQMFENRGRGNTTSLASQGQLYSGALQNAQTRTGLDYQQDLHGLRGQQDAVLAEIARRRVAASSAFEQGNIDALGASTDRALTAPVDPATLPPPKALASPNAGATYTQPKSSGRKKLRTKTTYR